MPVSGGQNVILKELILDLVLQVSQQSLVRLLPGGEGEESRGGEEERGAGWKERMRGVKGERCKRRKKRGERLWGKE